jgi:hypothetical protein
LSPLCFDIGFDFDVDFAFDFALIYREAVDFFLRFLRFDFAVVFELQERGLVVGGWRVVYVGGNWNNGNNAGLFQFNGNNESTNNNASVGCRLNICKGSSIAVKQSIPCHLAKIICGKARFSRRY